MGVSEIWTSDNSLFIHSYKTTPKSILVCPHTPLATALQDPLIHGGGGSGDKDEHSSSGPTSSSAVSPETTAAAITLDIQRKEQASPNLSTSAAATLAISCMISSLCNNATLLTDDELTEAAAGKTNGDAPPRRSTGDPTEVAMVESGRSAGFPREWFEKQHGLERIGEFAFDSDRKLMSVVYAVGVKSGGTERRSLFSDHDGFVLVKGAPEGVLQRCTSYLRPEGIHLTDTNVVDGEDEKNGVLLNILQGFPTAPLSDDFAQYLSNRNSSMAGRGLRVLALAMKKTQRSEAVDIVDSKKVERAESDLCFVGLIGMIDPPK